VERERVQALDDLRQPRAEVCERGDEDRKRREAREHPRGRAVRRCGRSRRIAQLDTRGPDGETRGGHRERGHQDADAIENAERQRDEVDREYQDDADERHRDRALERVEAGRPATEESPGGRRGGGPDGREHRRSTEELRIRHGLTPARWAPAAAGTARGTTRR
jgi:hypothetical protein